MRCSRDSEGRRRRGNGGSEMRVGDMSRQLSAATWRLNRVGHVIVLSQLVASAVLCVLGIFSSVWTLYSHHMPVY